MFVEAANAKLYISPNHPNICFICRKKQETEDPAVSQSASASGPEMVDEPTPSARDCGGCVVLEAENYFLKAARKAEDAEVEYASKRFTFAQVQDDPSLVSFYTGLPVSAFQFLLKCLEKAQLTYAFGWKVEKLKLEDQLLLMLYKLRHNPMNQDLAVRFCVSETCVANVFRTILSAVHQVLGALHAEVGIPSVPKNQTSIPACFGQFQGTKIILDCTEIECDVPRQDMTEQRQSFSHYKQRHTYKALVGVAPNGTITFVSDLYMGSASDKEVTMRSGLLRHLKPGDLVIADKGFTIQGILPEGVHLNVPPRLMHQQFTRSENRLTTDIARARIHVERAIERIKGYRILAHVPHHLKSCITTIFQVCSWLVNMQKPILSEVESSLK